MAAVLAEYVGGDLSVRQTIRINRHLSRCPACEASVADYQEVIRLAGSPPPPVPPPAAADRILAAMRAASGRPACRALDETVLEIPLLETSGSASTR